MSAGVGILGNGQNTLVISAPNGDVVNGTDVGKAYLFGSDDVLRQLMTTTTATTTTSTTGTTTTATMAMYPVINASVVIAGIIPDGNLGNAQVINDVNGDGRPDLYLVTDAEPSAGYIIFGTDMYDPDFTLAGLDGTDGFALSNGNGTLPTEIVVGDFNGDGINDIAFAEPNEFGNGTDLVIVHGQNMSVSFPSTLTLDDLKAQGDADILPLPGTLGGDSVGVSAGDVNGDGIDDVVVSTGGSVAIVHGAPGNDALDVTMVTGESPGFGKDAVNAGDINGDGIDDLVISDPTLNKTYVVFGTNGTGSDVSVGSLNGTNGFVIDGPAGFGDSIAALGDVNGDGLADIAVTSKDGSVPVVVILGSTGPHNASTPLSELDGVIPIELNDLARASNGSSVGDLLDGLFVVPVGDFNGDGLDDLVISVPELGRVYLVNGQMNLSEPITTDSLTSSDKGVILIGDPDE